MAEMKSEKRCANCKYRGEQTGVFVFRCKNKKKLTYVALTYRCNEWEERDQNG